MRCMGKSGGAAPRSNCARANGCVLPLRVVSCESSTAWTIRGRTLLSCAETNAARISSKRTTCDMRAKGTGAGCMDFSLRLHTSPPRALKHGEPQGKRELDEPPSSYFVQRVKPALHHEPEWRRVTWAGCGPSSYLPLCKCKGMSLVRKRKQDTDNPVKVQRDLHSSCCFVHGYSLFTSHLHNILYSQRSYS